MRNVILFIYKADRQRYGKYIVQLEKDVLKADLFSKSVLMHEEL